MSLRRPKPGEDDLEEMMREFEAQKFSPSASVAKKRAQDEDEAVGRNKKHQSIFSQKIIIFQKPSECD